MTRRCFVVLAVVALAIAHWESLASAQATHDQWDIISFGGVPPAASSGAVASATANDGSMITMTGTGTLVPPAGRAGSTSSATGGGTWETFAPSGASTGSGTYWVTGLVRWDPAPGSLPTPPFDNIGSPAERSAGLAVLRIEYSDGSRGVLVVSCRLVGSPASMPEGISATKGFMDYYSVLPPVPGVDANRTLFHDDPRHRPTAPTSNVPSRGWQSVSLVVARSETESQGETSRKLSATIESAIAESLRMDVYAASRHSILLKQGPAAKQGNGPSIAGIVVSAAIVATGAYLYERGSRNRHIDYLSGPPWVECSSEPPTRPRPPNWDQYPEIGSSCGKVYRVLGTTLMVIGGIGLTASFF
jgi:hypothetical protein